MNKDGSKLSKLDRLLVSSSFVDKWPNSHLLALPRELSDHCPIILKTHVLDFGPITFKFYNSWPKVLLEKSRQNDSTNTQPAIFLKDKLNSLKEDLKKWRDTKLNKDVINLKFLRAKVNFLDTKAECHDLNPQEKLDRLNFMKSITEWKT